MRVFGWQTLVRNESNEAGYRGAPSTDHDPSGERFELSMHVGTRKMVNYA